MGLIIHLYDFCILIILIFPRLTIQVTKKKYCKPDDSFRPLVFFCYSWSAFPEKVFLKIATFQQTFCPFSILLAG